MTLEYYEYSMRGGIALAMNKASVSLQPGVYFLVNQERTRMYVGSSVGGMYFRIQNHLSLLRHNKHSNRGLQRDWNNGTCFDYGIFFRFPDPADESGEWVAEATLRCVEQQMMENMRWQYSLYNTTSSCTCEICAKVADEVRLRHTR